MNNKQNNTNNKFGRVLAVPSLCELYPGICLTTDEKARKIMHLVGQHFATFLSISRCVNYYKIFSWPSVDNRYNYCTTINVCSLSTAVSTLPCITQVQVDGMVSVQTAGSTEIVSHSMFPDLPSSRVNFFHLLQYYSYCSVFTQFCWLTTQNFPFT
jgi:hypothetical protein